MPKKIHWTSCQDMVFIRPPGISDGAFQLRMDNIWFCKLLLLFTETRSYIAYIAYFAYVKSSHVLLFTDWVDKCQSAIVYKRYEQSQVLYVIPVSSILSWDGLHLFLWVRQELFPLKCEENQRTLPGHCAIKPRTLVTAVDGGT